MHHLGGPRVMSSGEPFGENHQYRSRQWVPPRGLRPELGPQRRHSAVGRTHATWTGVFDTKLISSNPLQPPEADAFHAQQPRVMLKRPA